jgi:hypothetical protein
LRWKRRDGTKQTLSLNSLITVLKCGHESRAVSFTKYGIDVVTAEGDLIRLPRSLATIQKKTFPSLEKGNLVMEMWQEVRKHLGDDPGDSEGTSSYQKDYGSEWESIGFRDNRLERCQDRTDP